MIDFTKIDKKAFGKHFDHTLLGKTCSEEEVRAAARLAVKYNCAAFGTATSYWAPVVREELEGTDLTTGCGIDYPLGLSCTAVKVFDAETAIKRGVNNLDFVMNVPAFKSKNYKLLHEECRAIKDVCGKDIPTKCIIEACFLEDEEIKIACQIIAEEGLEWVKSSTGMYAGPTIRQVEIMRDALEGTNTRVKVAGVKAPKPLNAFAYMLAGADLIGTQDAPMIIDALDEMRRLGIIPEYKG